MSSHIPPPPHVNSFVLGPAVINTHTHIIPLYQCPGLLYRSRSNARSLSHFPSPPPPSFTQSPSPPRSLVRDGQPSPHRPRLVVSRSTCPPKTAPPVYFEHQGLAICCFTNKIQLSSSLSQSPSPPSTRWRGGGLRETAMSAASTALPR
jgi:hypothetical protein